MRDIKEFLIIEQSELYQAIAKNGKNKFWQKRIHKDSEGQIYTSSLTYHETKEGLSIPIESALKLIKGKNIGKVNETTPLAQARSEMASEILSKRDSGFCLPDEQPIIPTLPMLAHEFKKHSNKVTYPVFIQPKLDGVRCLYNGLNFWSRKGKKFLTSVTSHLVFDTENQILDGELMLPPPYTFQQTVSAIKKYDPELSPQLRYYIYDVITDQTFEERNLYLNEINNSRVYPKDIIFLDTIIVTDEEELMLKHLTFVDMGYEGSMVRSKHGKYLIKHRSTDLLKLKDFIDEEFIIVGVIEGEAKEKGKAIFQCISSNDLVFRVRPKGTDDHRAKLWKERDSLIGKQLTVRYQNLSDDGIPRFPAGISIRDYE